MTTLPILAGALLDDETLVEIQGPDACRFLQGQVTCDVLQLPDGGHTLGACCDNKGRMLATFRLYKASPERLLLRLPRGVASPLVVHLARYKVFFKCAMTILDTWSIWGVWPPMAGPDPASSSAAKDGPSAVELATRGHGIAIVHDCSARFEIWLPTEPEQRAESLPTILTAGGCTLAREQAASWYRQEFCAGIGRVLPETMGRFVPHQLNLQTLEAISFKKGCYTGQEIVARMHYLGKLKKSMHLFRSDLSPSDALVTLPVPGGALFLASGSGGEVVEVLHDGIRLYVLAVMDNDLVATMPVYLDASHRILLVGVPLPCVEPC